MLFAKSSAGIEISPSGVSSVLVGGSSSAPFLQKIGYAPFEAGVVRATLRDFNILNPDAFVATVRSSHNLLLRSATRVSVSLPDASGRVMILDIEGRFKSRSEALDVIRWKLKKSLPFDPADTHLDFQQLTVRENGDLALLVALVSRAVIEQYEELLVKAGLMPARIDFNVFSICRLFQERQALLDDFVMVIFYGGSLSILGFYQGIPEFIRIKDMLSATVPDSRLFMEINNSLLVYRERFPDHVSSSVFCMASPEMAETFVAMVSEAAGGTATLLEVKAVIQPGDSVPGDQLRLFPFSSAIGAAMRNL